MSTRSPGSGAGLLGAAVGLTLTGALVTLVARLEDAGPGPLWFAGWIVLYPIGAVAGYDLAARGGALGDGPFLLRAGGLAMALAGAHVWVAATFAIGTWAGVPGWSTFWAVAYAACVAGAAAGRAGAVRLADGYQATPGMLVAVAVVVILLAWLVDFIVLGIQLARVDS